MTQEQALILQQDGMVNSPQTASGAHLVEVSPGGWTSFPTLRTSCGPNPNLSLPPQIPQKFRQQVFLGCLPHPLRLGGGGFEVSPGLYLELFPSQLRGG
jgi:hypothetical protein